jgi:hypothetical protein
MLNTAFNLIDSHDHTTGKGTKVTPAGINVNQNFNFSGFGIYGLNYAKLVDNVATVSDFTSVYAEGGDLYWKNAGGVDVQITSGNTINVTAAGGIGGDYTTSTASVVYSDITKTYTFRQSPTVTGDIAAGSLYVYENVVSGKYAKLQVPAGLAANYDITLPAALPANKSLLAMSSSGVLTTDGSTLIPSSTLDVQNYTIVASVAASALTIAVKTLAGTDASAADPAAISFRSDTATSGVFVKRTITSALSVVVSSGSTLGQSNATAQYIYVYALDNAGTVELAVSSTLFNDRVVQSTTAEGGAGAADSSSVLYSTTARTSKAIRLIARLTSNQTTAGTWAAVPTAITLMPENPEPVNYAVSASSGGFSTTSASLVDVTNLSVTITTSGRPVLVQVISDGSANAVFNTISQTASDTVVISAPNLLLRNGSIVGRYILRASVQSSATDTGLEINTPPFSFIDTPTAGLQTYKIQVSAGFQTSINYSNAKLIAVEL